MLGGAGDTVAYAATAEIPEFRIWTLFGEHIAEQEQECRALLRSPAAEITAGGGSVR